MFTFDEVAKLFTDHSIEFKNLSEEADGDWAVTLNSKSGDLNESRKLVKDLHTSIKLLGPNKDYGSRWPLADDGWDHHIHFSFKDK